MTLIEVLKQGLIVNNDNARIKISIKDTVLIYKGTRPTNMDKHLFKSVRRELNKLLKEHKKGEVFHLSKMAESLWYELGGRGKQHGATFKGKVHDKGR